jgi:hypothetical protein
MKMETKRSLLTLASMALGQRCAAQFDEPAFRTSEPTAAPSAPADGQNVPALKNVFKGRFLIGGALNRSVVTGRDAGAAPAETQKKLAEKYAEIFSVLLKHKKDIARVTFWGVYDATSWIGGSPLLFDRNCQPKEAFFAVVKTAQKGRQN